MTLMASLQAIELLVLGGWARHIAKWSGDLRGTKQEKGIFDDGWSLIQSLSSVVSLRRGFVIPLKWLFEAFDGLLLLVFSLTSILEALS